MAFHKINAVSHSKLSLVKNLRKSPTNDFLTMEMLHATYKFNVFSTDKDSKLTTNKIRNKNNQLYLKMILIL